MFDFNNVVFHNHMVVFDDKEYADIMDTLNNFCNKLNKNNQSHDYYKQTRNAVAPEYDNVIGKLSEIAVAKYFLDFGFPEIEIDFGVRKGRKKGWVCDLPYKNLDDTLPNCHVKACSTTARRMLLKVGDEYSWTFQYKTSGYGGKDILFTDEFMDDLIVMTYVPELENKCVEVVVSAPWRAIKDIMKPPLKKTLINQKKCVYYKDLMENKKV